MVEVSLLAAFLGGVLSLLSPCSALLLPAFFAYAFGGGGGLVRKTGVFYLGLCATLVPLGMGISAVSSLFYGQRRLLIVAAGTLLVVLGLLLIFGRGFGMGPLSRPVSRLRGGVRGDSAGAVFALGAVYGFGGFCSGPILGAVLTVAAAGGGAGGGAAGGALRGAPWGALLLAVYALGMAAPLFGMAALWDRLRLRERRFVRGWEVAVGPLRLHTTNLVSGAVFVALGLFFIAYEGTADLSGLYAGAEGLALEAQRRISAVVGGVPDAAVLAVAGACVVWLALRALSRRGKGGKDGKSGKDDEPDGR